VEEFVAMSTIVEKLTIVTLALATALVMSAALGALAFDGEAPPPSACELAL
jgi:hypothetical protein